MVRVMVDGPVGQHEVGDPAQAEANLREQPEVAHVEDVLALREDLARRALKTLFK